jgi:hypothetical protein
MRALFLATSWAIALLLNAGGLAWGQGFNAVVVGPSSPNGPAVGLVPQTGIGAAADTLLAQPGNVYGVYAANRTATAGFLILYNATVAPAPGTLTANLVLGCAALPASGTGYLNFAPGPPLRASIGAVALVSSGANCVTYTTGTITADIFGSAL